MEETIETNEDLFIFGLGVMIILFAMGLITIHYTLEMFNYTSHLFNVVILYSSGFGILVMIFGFIFPSLKKQKNGGKKK